MEDIKFDKEVPMGRLAELKFQNGFTASILEVDHTKPASRLAVNDYEILIRDQDGKARYDTDMGSDVLPFSKSDEGIEDMLDALNDISRLDSNGRLSKFAHKSSVLAQSIRDNNFGSVGLNAVNSQRSALQQEGYNIYGRNFGVRTY